MMWVAKEFGRPVRLRDGFARFGGAGVFHLQRLFDL